MRLPRYAKYKDSEVEWLGDVPAHWNFTRPKHICTFTTGWTPPTGDSSAYEGDNLWANISDLGGRTISDTTKRISDEAISKARISISPRGSLLFSFKLSIGQVSFVGRDMYTNEAIATFRSSDQLSVAYAYFAFPLFLVENAAENIYGAKLLNQELIRSALLALPLKPEQEAIATFLDRETAKIDALITEQEKLLALLAEKRQATISHVVTRGLNPDVPMKDSGVPWLGEVPAHWKIAPLKFLVSLRSGGTPSKDRLDFWDGQVPWASARDLKSETLSDTALHLTDLAMESGASVLLPAGTVLVVVRGMILARTFPVTEALVPMAINQDLKGVLPKSGLNQSFLVWLLRGTANESLQRLDEAGHGTKALRMEAWTSMAMPVPPVIEQREIVAFIKNQVADVDKLVLGAERAIELIKERRGALIAAAVTGKIDVRGLMEARAV